MKVYKTYGSKERLFEMLYHLNEIDLDNELVGKFKVFDVLIEVYKNPKKISKLKHDIRGISTPDGDLYVVNENWYVTHSMLSTFLKENGVDIPNNTFLDKKYINWIRNNDSNKFYLSESYKPTDLKNIELNESFLKVKEKNPQLEFIFNQS